MSAAPSRLRDLLGEDLVERLQHGVAVLVAMDEEEEPFLRLCTPLGESVEHGMARYTPLEHQGTPMLLARTRIGLVNAASAATAAIELMAPRAIFSAGSAGGLRADVEVGDLAVGSSYAFTDADATAFGYERGQVPGMPVLYSPGAGLLAAARAAQPQAEGTRHVGPMLAGGSFVTAANVKDTREAFPEAVSTDMETTAIAQVAGSFGTDFLSVRGISDLCGPAADQDFHLAVEIVAERSARTVLDVVAATAG